MDYLFTAKRKVNNEWQYCSVLYPNAHYTANSAYTHMKAYWTALKGLDANTWVASEESETGFMELTSGSGSSNYASKCDVILGIKSSSSNMTNRVSFEIKNSSTSALDDDFGAKLLTEGGGSINAKDWLIVSAIFILHD